MTGVTDPVTDLVIETHGLRKTFRDRGRRVVAVDDLDLSVPRGGVHGFLGPNGSGKTTTIRMLLGLARPDGGEIRVLGDRLPDALAEVVGRVGAMVEQPLFAPDLSARRNLMLLARSAGIRRARVGELLEQFELPRRRPFHAYSSGMRQRLGVAAALLKEPELLLLDEPTNGLDPAGISDMRETVRRLGETGVTVLLSSHILAEVQQVCASVSIIGEGRLLASGTVEELIGESVSRTRVGVADPVAAEATLTSAGYSVRRDGDFLLVEGHERPEEISRVLAEHGAYVRELSAVRPDLESFFLELTGHLPAGAKDDGGDPE